LLRVTRSLGDEQESDRQSKAIRLCGPRERGGVLLTIRRG